MSPYKPLLFLTVRTLVNGVKRALTTPRRLISFLAFIGYYFLVFMRPAFMPSRAPALPMGTTPQWDLPPMVVLDAVAFGLFLLLSLFMLMGVSSSTGSFKPADVDVLFSTPISPRIILVFRILRDYLITLVFPFVIALFTIRPAKLGWEALFRNMPPGTSSGLTLRAISISWILMAMAWVCIGYATSLFINRSDRQSDRNRKVLGWGIFAVVAFVAAFAGISLRTYEQPSDLVALAESPVLRVLFFTASFATMTTMAPLSGAWSMGAVGLLGLVAIIVVAVRVAMTQAEWMYDQAAVKGFSTAKFRDLQRSGDVMAFQAERAREGKFKFRRAPWIHRWKPKGALSLVWKEYLLLTRGMMGQFVMLLLVGVGMTVMVVLIPAKRPHLLGPFMLGMQMMGLFMTTTSVSQIGFLETLRRIDLTKPMPFSPAVTVFSEVFAKSLIGGLSSLLGAAVVVAIKPMLWEWALAGLVAAPAMSLLLSATGFLIVMLFPDLDDPSQRQFRGLMFLLATVIFAVFPIGAFLLLTMVHAAPVVAALVGAVIALGIAVGLCFISGQLYASFNPSE